MIFDEKRLAYGVENPLVKKGAKGYFSDNYRSIRRMVDEDNIIPCELKDVDLSQPFPYENEFGYLYTLFYVVEEVGELLPLSNEDLHALLGTTITNAVTGDNCVVATYIESYKDSNASVVLSSPCGIRHTNPLPAMYLLRDYRYVNGGIIGKPSVNKCNDEE